MFEISRYSGKIKNTVLNIVFPQDDTSLYYTEYIDWLSLDNSPIFVDFFDGEQLECLNKKAIEIDLDYTYRIARLMDKHNDKFIEGLRIDIPYTIPESAIIERQRLKDECNAKITALGVIDFTYRQSDIRLTK